MYVKYVGYTLEGRSLKHYGIGEPLIQKHLSPAIPPALYLDFFCQPRTAIATVLRGDDVRGWMSHFGLKCSSWTAVNAGTSGRSACSSIGDTRHPSVREANCMGSRKFVKHFIDYFGSCRDHFSRISDLYVMLA